MELLIQCARVRPDAEALCRAAEGVSDWQVAIGQATLHGLGPLLYWRLKGCHPGIVPPPVAERMQRAFHANAARNLMMAAELYAVLHWLKAGGVPAIAYKGPTLAVWAYGNVALREFSDLDVLVRPEDKKLAISTLAIKGCVETGTAGADGLTGNCEIGLRTPNGYAVDLHWEISSPYFPAFDARAAWQRLQQVELAGGTVTTFAADDLFLCLALHGARHCWTSLGWISDVAHLVAAAPLDWDRLVTNPRSRRMVHVASLLAADLLAAPVPTEVVGNARRDTQAAAVSRQVAATLFSGNGNTAGRASGAVMHLKMMAGLRDRARYLWRRGFEANQTDNDFLPLPAPLRPLLYAVRPFRVLGKLMSRA